MTVTFAGKTICDGAAFAGQPGKAVGPLGPNTVRTSWDQAARKYIGAAEAVPANLGNALGEYPLTVGIEFATVQEAQLFAYAHAKSLPPEGALAIAGDGGESETFPKASIAECQVEQTGCACLVTYKFITGATDE